MISFKNGNINFKNLTEEKNSQKSFTNSWIRMRIHNTVLTSIVAFPQEPSSQLGLFPTVHFTVRQLPNLSFSLEALYRSRFY